MSWKLRLRYLGLVALFPSLCMIAWTGLYVLLSRIPETVLDFLDTNPAMLCFLVGTGMVGLGYYWYFKQQRLLKELQAGFLALSYSDPVAYEGLKGRLCGQVARNDWPPEPSLGGFVREDLPRYGRNKNVVLGLMILADEVISEYPVTGYPATGYSTRLDLAFVGERWLKRSVRSQPIEKLDSLICSHLADDIKARFPEEVYHLRVNFLRDYMSCQNKSMYHNEETDDWYLRHGYDLSEELPVLLFLQAHSST